MTGTSNIFIGTSGWTIPSEHKHLFPKDGTHLERYAQVFNAVEINSSFYQDHQYSTYQRWKMSVPDGFGFAVKLNKLFTHEQKLNIRYAELEQSLSHFAGLEQKWKVLLVQLPPKLACHLKQAEKFFMALRSLYAGAIVLEARNGSWAHPDTLDMYRDLGISLVFADPERCEAPYAARMAGELAYFRYHGSPVIYRSAYTEGILSGLARSLGSYQRAQCESWCLFDNTAFGAATLNAYELKQLLSESKA